MARDVSNCKRNKGEREAYLSTIQVMSGQFIEITIREFICHTTTLSYHGNEALPNVLLRLDTQLCILERDVNTALERLVECLNTIGGEEQNTLEVFEQSQEDGHERITMHILVLTLLQKHI